ncbi:MAG: DNA internalization-related competence protein ComEC/Rec2 [Deltaproteobacteria bacterium]|nr:DNA internalization-related competence protein ComEC/Rec2 [Deltaproteobacteria bacterium]
MVNRPFVPLTAALTLGICTGSYIHLPDTIILFCLIVSLVILLILRNETLQELFRGSFQERANTSRASLFLYKISETLKGQTAPIMFFLFLPLFFIGIVNINLYLHPKPGPGHIIHYIDQKPIVMEGVIVDSPRFSSDKMDLIVSAAAIIKDGVAIPIKGRILIAVRGYYPFRYGDYLRFPVKLKTPHNFQNPGGFDYERYLLYQRVQVRGFISGPEKIVIMRQNQGHPIRAVMEEFRTHLKTVIYENAASPQREIIQAIILGDQNEIPRDVREKFNRTGVSHIIAISGFNVGIIAVFSLFVIRLLLKSSERFLLKYNMITLSTLFAVIPVIIFCFIAGMGISVVRATIMVVVFMTAILIGRQRDLYNTLALTAFIILIVAPYSLFDVSFQLSFAAVFAILFITPRLSGALTFALVEDLKQLHPRISKIVLAPAMFILVTLSATLGTWPLIIFYFNRLSNVVLPANIIVVPILGILAIPVSMAIIITAPLAAGLSVPFIYVSSFLVETSLKLVDFFDSIPGASRIITTPSLMEIAAYYMLLFAAVALLDRKNHEPGKKDQRRLLFLKGTCALLVFFFIGHAVYLHAASRQNSHLCMTVIDVGQGSSTLFRLPGGKTLLIDGGGFPNSNFDIGKNVVAPFLLYHRIKRIDYIVLTHPHPDHLGGLIYLLENFTIGEVWTNGQGADTMMYRDFLKNIEKHHLVHRIVSEKSGTFSIGRVRLDIMNPEQPLDKLSGLSDQFNDVNNHSLVIKLTFGNITFLATGDIETETEKRLVSTGKDLKSTVLIFPHHGGYTSGTTPFLRRVQPRIAVIGCGKDNIYHVPHPDVLRRLQDADVRVFRTDRHGAISIKTDGTNLTIKTLDAT